MDNHKNYNVSNKSYIPFLVLRFFTRPCNLKMNLIGFFTFGYTFRKCC